MFERYTEKARRVIFFARYEASQFGSPYIETEHLLLGLLREDRFINTLLPTGRELIRKEIEAESLIRERVSPTADLPLSNECKRVLANAAEEADRLGDKHIGGEHLFLGLLREEGSFAARILTQHGVELKKARVVIRQQVIPDSTASIFMVHGTAWRASYLRDIAQDLRRYYWEKREWKSRDLLVEKQTGKIMFYSGAPYDAVRFEVRKGAWKRDHCAICRWELNESSDVEHGTGYTNNQDWVCTECYDKVIAPTVFPEGPAD
jgi:Clp amino terminal domain, pathogenicity island component